MNFGFTPEYTLNMGYTLLMHMFEEHASLNRVDDKDNKKEMSLMELAAQSGVRIK